LQFLSTMGRIIGIDYGLKRVGLAVTDPMRIIASGLDTIDNNQIFTYLKSYISKENVDEIVVGFPLSLKGDATHATAAVEHFIEQLKIAFPNVKVFSIDERFTSKMAVQTLVGAGIGKEKRKNKALIDKVSATIILQSYLQKYDS